MANYTAKLEAFASKVRGFRQVWVEVHYKGNGQILTSSWHRVETGQSCDCCGTKRLKMRYPIAKGETIYWIGVECVTNLLKLCVIESYSFPEKQKIIIEEAGLPHI